MNLKHSFLQAHTLSSIAGCDWPDEYPDLLSSLIALLSSNSPDSVHGAMQVFTEFIKSDLTEDQILPVLRELLPVLLQILGATEVMVLNIGILVYRADIYMAATHSSHTSSHYHRLSAVRGLPIYGERPASTGC